MQQHYIMKFQNQYKKLKNIVLLFLSWKGICLTKHWHVHYQIEKKKKKRIKRWEKKRGDSEGGEWKEGKTYSCSYVCNGT